MRQLLESVRPACLRAERGHHPSDGEWTPSAAHRVHRADGQGLHIALATPPDAVRTAAERLVNLNGRRIKTSAAAGTAAGAAAGTSRISRCTTAVLSTVRPRSKVQVAEAGGLQGGDVPLAVVLLGIDVPRYGQPAAYFFNRLESVLVAPRVEAVEQERGVLDAVA